MAGLGWTFPWACAAPIPAREHNIATTFLFTRSPKTSDSSGTRPNSTTVLLQVELNRAGRASDIQLSIALIDDEWCIARERLAGGAGFNVSGAVIKVDPANVMFDHPSHYQLLEVAVFVPWHWRFKVDRCDLVFVELCSDYEIGMLASEHWSNAYRLSWLLRLRSRT
jgi:hypothetical protein